MLQFDIIQSNIVRRNSTLIFLGNDRKVYEADKHFTLCKPTKRIVIMFIVTVIVCVASCIIYSDMFVSFALMHSLLFKLVYQLWYSESLKEWVKDTKFTFFKDTSYNNIISLCCGYCSILYLVNILLMLLLMSNSLTLLVSEENNIIAYLTILVGWTSVGCLQVITSHKSADKLDLN